MMGLEWPSPGMVVFHTMFSEFATFQAVAVVDPLAIPSAFGPRNEGQLVCAEAGQATDSMAKQSL